MSVQPLRLYPCTFSWYLSGGILQSQDKVGSLSRKILKFSGDIRQTCPLSDLPSPSVNSKLVSEVSSLSLKSVCAPYSLP